MSAFVLKLLLGVLGFTTVVGGLTAAWFYVQDLKSDNELLAKEVAQKEFEVEQNMLALETYKKETERMLVIIRERDEAIAEITEQRDFANKQLERHDRNYLALNKPELVAGILNREAEKRERCIEIQINKAELTEAELNASRPSEINIFCWQDANPRFDPDLWPEWKERNLQ